MFFCCCYCVSIAQSLLLLLLLSAFFNSSRWKEEFVMQTVNLWYIDSIIHPEWAALHENSLLFLSLNWSFRTLQLSSLCVCVCGMFFYTRTIQSCLSRCRNSELCEHDTYVKRCAQSIEKCIRRTVIILYWIILM